MGWQVKSCNWQGVGKALMEWFISDGYLYDWVVAAIVLIVNFTVPLSAILPVTRYYTPQDPSLSYPMETTTVSGTTLVILSVIVPVGAFTLICLLYRSLSDWHHACLSLAEAFALGTGFKRWMNLVGRYRPDWLSRLETGVSATIDDGRQSYPSGHATYMFVGMTVLFCFLVGKTKVLSKPGKGCFGIGILCISPIALATWVAVTRPMNYRHDFSDINAGTFIGIASGLVGYLFNHESLTAPSAGAIKLRRGQQAPSAEQGPSASLAGVPPGSVAGARASGGTVVAGEEGGLIRTRSHKYNPLLETELGVGPASRTATAESSV